MADGQWYWLRVFGFFAAFIFWSLCSWYAARVLLYFISRAAAGPILLRNVSPHQTRARFLGHCADLDRGRGFSRGSSVRVGFAGEKVAERVRRFCLLLAVIFYILLVFRRKMSGRGVGTGPGVSGARA